MRRWSHETAIGYCLATIGMMLIGSQVNGAERELAAHQHGHGYLNIAIEGSTMWIELETPGADIVGFEHPARSDGDKAAIADAKARLGDPVGLFGIPSQASCTLDEASVMPVGYEPEADDDHHGEHEEDDHDTHDEDPHEGDEHDEASHAEFHAEYRLQCDDPAAIARLAFGYFDIFPAAQELEVTVISDHGQSRQVITREAPIAHLGGDE